MNKALQLVCEPIQTPDGLQGHVVLYQFSAEFLRGLLHLRRHVVHALAATTADFDRASFFVAPGEWLRSIDLPQAVEFDDAWVELDDSQPSAAENASERVRSEGWTLALGTDDVRLQFREKHHDHELATPTLSYAAIAALLQRLESSTPRDKP